MDGNQTGFNAVRMSRLPPVSGRRMFPRLRWALSTASSPSSSVSSWEVSPAQTPPTVAASTQWYFEEGRRKRYSPGLTFKEFCLYPELFNPEDFREEDIRIDRDDENEDEKPPLSPSIIHAQPAVEDAGNKDDIESWSKLKSVIRAGGQVMSRKPVFTVIPSSSDDVYPKDAISYSMVTPVSLNTSVIDKRQLSNWNALHRQLKNNNQTKDVARVRFMGSLQSKKTVGAVAKGYKKNDGTQLPPVQTSRKVHRNAHVGFSDTEITYLSKLLFSCPRLCYPCSRTTTERPVQIYIAQHNSTNVPTAMRLGTITVEKNKPCIPPSRRKDTMGLVFNRQSLSLHPPKPRGRRKRIR